MTTTSFRPRVSPGVPSGGQFTQKSRTETAIGLADFWTSHDTDGEPGPDYDTDRLLDLDAPLPDRPNASADVDAVERAIHELGDRASAGTRALESRLATAKVVTGVYATVADPTKIAYVRVDESYAREGGKRRELVPLNENFQPLNVKGEPVNTEGLRHDARRGDYVNDGPISDIAAQRGIDPFSPAGLALVPLDGIKTTGDMVKRALTRREPAPAKAAYDGNVSDLASDFIVDEPSTNRSLRLPKTIIDVRAIVSRDWRTDIAQTTQQATRDTDRAVALRSLLDD